MKNKITTGVAGLIIGSITAISLSTSAQTTIQVEKDINKAREELIITRTETVDITTIITLKQVNSEIANINKQIANINARTAKIKQELNERRTKLIELKSEIEAKLPTQI